MAVPVTASGGASPAGHMTPPKLGFGHGVTQDCCTCLPVEILAEARGASEAFAVGPACG